MGINYDGDEIFNRAVAAFGIENRLNKFREECAEAVVAVDRLLNGRKDALIELIYEIADVTIMLDHAKRIVESMLPDYTEKKIFIENVIEKKTKKLIEQIERKEKIEQIKMKEKEIADN